MEDEIDVRQYIRVLVRHWKWIVGTTLVAAIAALVASFFLPRVYEATALAAITKPRYIMQFDPRFETVNNIQPAYKIYPELALSDDLLQALFAQLNPVPKGVETASDLSEMVAANPGSDPSIVRLSVQSKDPVEAAYVANTWMNLFVARANEIYGNQGEDQVQFFETQLQRAQADLDTAEQALVEFQAHNQVATYKNQLDSLTKMHSDYLTNQRTITYTVQDIQGLRDQVAAQPGGSSALADQLTALLLQIKAFNAQTGGSPQFQITNVESISTKSPSEQAALLDNLAEILRAESAETDARLAELEPQILDMQKKLEEAQADQARLTRARDVAQETCTALARKVDEVRIAAQTASGDVKPVSKAAVPIKPVGARKLFYAAVAGALGLMLAVFIVFVIEWWRGEPRPMMEKKG